jgi:hypothetical protein
MHICDDKRPTLILSLGLALVLLMLVGCGGMGSNLADRTPQSFSVSVEGVITDNTSGLEWVVGPGLKTGPIDAEVWVERLKFAGGGWRMPTIEELRGLYIKGRGKSNLDPVFKTTGWNVWAVPFKYTAMYWGNSYSGASEKSECRFFDFLSGRESPRYWDPRSGWKLGYGNDYPTFLNDSVKNGRAFGVREVARKNPGHKAMTAAKVVIDPRSYSVSTEGVITDNTNGLDWVIGPEMGISFNDAKTWVKDCKIAGGGWRMPTWEELCSLEVRIQSQSNLPPVFKTTGWFVWCASADQKAGTKRVCSKDFAFGNKSQFTTTRDNIDYFDAYYRVFGVRSHPLVDPVTGKAR